VILQINYDVIKLQEY